MQGTVRIAINLLDVLCLSRNIQDIQEAQRLGLRRGIGLYPRVRPFVSG